MSARARLMRRVEALAIGAVFLAAVLAAVSHSGRTPAESQANNAPSITSPSPSSGVVSVMPSSRPEVVVAGVHGETSVKVVPAPAPSKGGTSTGPTESPTPTPAPTFSGSWTECGPDANGNLFCHGKKEAFTCSTNAAGATSCSWGSRSFSCATDPSSGARDCRSAAGSWQCMTDPQTGRTGCNGAQGTYSCGASPGASDTCAGTHSFFCYDKSDGQRVCGTQAPNDPDCFFEPIFGVICRT